jgi:hypothetical protein
MASTPNRSERSSQPQFPAQHCPHEQPSCNSQDRKIVCDACCGSCMVFLRTIFTCGATLTPPSTPRTPICDSEWWHSSWPARLDATHGPNVDLGSSMRSGGMALTISSLAEYTLLMNACIHSLIYITVSPRCLNSPSTHSSLSPIGDHPKVAQPEHHKRLPHFIHHRQNVRRS